MSTDGLAALTAQRAKASSRSMPPPRHAPKAAKPAELTGDSASTTTPPASPTAEPQTEPQHVSPVASLPVAPPPPGPQTVVGDQLVRASIYLDASMDDFLEQVRVAGRRARPKIDASRSAVTRLALDRLSRQLGADEILSELVSRAKLADRESVGRPRL